MLFVREVEFLFDYDNLIKYLYPSWVEHSFLGNYFFMVAKYIDYFFVFFFISVFHSCCNHIKRWEI